ncbi:P-loop containing nucleoside triphosphate hydrolase protein [Mycena pura]|uniref:RNA helicase n=1 Tax=Mycena pura TaxID=153505 RepID=A0AAD6V3K2_9AGAR|nr:P-loop containing nucleoside triphosphate hydrolase protein [Mycena pura]
MGLREDRPESYGLSASRQPSQFSAREETSWQTQVPDHRRVRSPKDRPNPPTRKHKADSSTPPSPHKEGTEIPLFYNPPAILALAGVPIIAKSDPTTASTTLSYSPAMAMKNDLPRKFTSPPLLPGLLQGLTHVLNGPAAVPTPIQALSLKWVVDPWMPSREEQAEGAVVSTDTQANMAPHKEVLLASETGSGKSIAYLLPMLQALKVNEVRRRAAGTPASQPRRALNPRALVLAPTHELARQLAGFAKALVHDVKLRVLCASRPNVVARDPTVAGNGKHRSNASRMKAMLNFMEGAPVGELQVRETDMDIYANAIPVDVVVGTPMKLMEMVRGRGWEREVGFGGGIAAAEKRAVSEDDPDHKENAPDRKLRRGRDSLPGVGKWRSSAEMGLSEIEWVIVDEADVLFDSDFQETTRMLLADIAKARGREVPFTPLPVGLVATSPPAPTPASTTPRKDKKGQEKGLARAVKNGLSVITPLNYPFNLVLTSATIPNSLSNYLNAYHPGIMRLVSPNIHHLPKTLKTEYVSWTGGNKNADIERRLREVWAADATQGLGPVPDSQGDMSKVLIFCNKNSKVSDLGKFLEEHGIKNIQLSGSSENRKRGSNMHLDGFLKPPVRNVKQRENDAMTANENALPEDVKNANASQSLVPVSKRDQVEEPINDPMHVPHVMITTSLLSRGLDFSPNIKHVFIIDEPRNMIDFLHRAGRTGRAGAHGKVVIFGKMKGRGSQRSREVRKKVKALRA